MTQWLNISMAEASQLSHPAVVAEKLYNLDHSYILSLEAIFN
jgi:hypothetical protein